MPQYNYPVKRKPYQAKKISTSNRGMLFEDLLNESNAKYLDRDIAVIYKKPIPIQIVNVDYPKRSEAKITEAFYKVPSTTDYNGVYRGYYIDFDAKQCNSLTSFPLSNVHQHQILHLERIEKHGGIGFLLIYFNRLDEIYLLRSKDLSKFSSEAKAGGRKSIPIESFRENCILIKESFPIRVPYLNAVDIIIDEIEANKKQA
ncbi:MAG: Holliday junction resolvase RecU [Gammaproteobacteria bacterium]|nr:Holliday junction resolvase RecU [Gammaproteobacteria bacterium]